MPVPTPRSLEQLLSDTLTRLQILEARAATSLSMRVPAGAGMEWMGSTAPAGWALQDGSVLLREDHPALFAVIGTTYNTGGETSLQFRLPNRKGRVGVGLDAGQTEFDTLGETGGAKTHTLTYAQTPVQKGVRMTWGTGGNINFSGNPSAAPGGASGNGLTTAQNDPAYDADAAGGFANGGQPHNNLQPYLTINYIIKL